MNRKNKEKSAKSSKLKWIRTAKRMRSPVNIWEFENYAKERLKASGIIQ